MINAVTNLNVNTGYGRTAPRSENATALIKQLQADLALHKFALARVERVVHKEDTVLWGGSRIFQPCSTGIVSTFSPKTAQEQTVSNYEKRIIEYEAARNEAMDQWFEARTHIIRQDSFNQNIFKGGFRLAWELSHTAYDDSEASE